MLFQEEPITGPGRERMMVFQQPALFPWLTTEQNIAYGLKLRANRGNGLVRDERRCEVLQLVGLNGFARHYPSDLSGGMRHLEIARALAVNPQVLLMDEPLAALNALTRRYAARGAAHMGEETQKTIVFVTHDIDEAVIMADRVVIMARRPSFVLEVEKVDLPRPRLRDDPAVAKLDATAVVAARMTRPSWILRLLSPLCVLLLWEAGEPNRRFSIRCCSGRRARRCGPLGVLITSGYMAKALYASLFRVACRFAIAVANGRSTRCGDGAYPPRQRPF